MDTPTVYRGTKELLAWSMTRGEYNKYRNWEMPSDEDADEMGYLVEYLDGGKANDERHNGYISWSPADVFNKAYYPLTGNALGINQASPTAMSDDGWQRHENRRNALRALAEVNRGNCISAYGLIQEAEQLAEWLDSPLPEVSD